MTSPMGAVRKFNPGTGQTDDEVIRQFVVRESELEILLDVLRSNIDAACCQSTLVVAPRGAGKTMLLARTAAELRSNPEYSQHLLPVRFMEESHEAYDIGEFWLEVLFHLILEIESTAPDLAHELRRSRDDLCARWRPDLAPQAFGTLLDAAGRLDRRLVLIVENLQNLCRDADDEFGWSLRAVLQNEPRIMLLGSATTRFPELRKADEPFFELFRFVDLKPLDSAACLRLWGTVSGDGASERTIRPLEIFTGGSPRLLVIVAEFALHRSLPRLMEELVTLIDNHTEYFRGHLEQLPRGEKRVYVAIIDLWQPSGTGEIAQRARMDVRPTSTCIGRLLERGLISSQGTGRRKRYVATERLYSIYYKLRRERDEAAVVRNLIRFMVAFYSPDHLLGMSDDFVHGASESVAIYQGIARALRDEHTFVGVFESGFLAPVTKAVEEGRHEQALLACERLLTGEALPPATTCKVLAIKANCLDEVGNHRAELAVYEELIQRFGGEEDPVVQELVWNAKANRCAALNELGDAAAAIGACDRIIERFCEPENPAAETRLAMALANKADALRDDGQFATLVDTLDGIVARFGDREEKDLKLLAIVALVNKGTALDLMDDTTSAVATYDAAWRRYGDCEIPEAQVRLASALFNRGLGLGKMDDHKGAIDAYETLDRTYGDSPDPEIQYWVAQGLVNLGATLSRDADDSPRAIRIFDQVVDRFAATDEPNIRRQVATALLNRGVAQLRLGDLESAIATWDDVVVRFSPGPDEQTRVLAVSAMIRKAGALDVAQSHDESQAALNQVFTSFADVEGLRVHLGRALVTRAALEIAHDRPHAALATCDQLEREFATVDDEAFVWRARCYAARALLTLGDLDAAHARFELAYQVFHPDMRAIGDMILLVSEALGAGFRPKYLVDLLSADQDKADTLTPLIVAVRQEGGEDVRAAEEVLEVAADIRASWLDEAQGNSEKPANNPV
ncbi:MAG: AAA family ATPase [Gammaproteobacteria bacterium]|nr:AAA family ATPase [Gammaproteobacteria bacterium]